MKYVLILGDGMADEPLQNWGRQDASGVCRYSAMDELAALSEIGMVKTVPEGMNPGSDTANLSVLGYDPKVYYSGRSPLEALNIGVEMKDGDVAIRANIVTLSEEEENYEDKRISDHSSDEIRTEDAAVLLEAVKKELQNEMFQFYVGTSYRHCLIWAKGDVVPLTPPHDIRGKGIKDYLPKEQLLLDMQKKSYKSGPLTLLNEERKKKGLNPANSLWFWGAGTKPALSSFEEKYHKKGAMISAVDLLKGIAVGTDMYNITVEGAENGGLNTNYEGKAQAAVDALLKEGYDFAYIHVEAPDEMGHQGSVEKKIKAIEYLDARVIRLVKDALDASGQEYRMLGMPDHADPYLCEDTYSQPGSLSLYDSRRQETHDWMYNEDEASKSGKLVEKGHELMGYLFEM